MTSSLPSMLTCLWSARRIQRYLDADPSASLKPAELHRLATHLAVCERCSRLTDEHRALRRALARWSGQRLPDPAAVGRLQAVLHQLVDQEPPPTA